MSSPRRVSSGASFRAVGLLFFLLSCLGAYAIWAFTRPAQRLESWIASWSKPGFVVLYSDSMRGHHLAIVDAGNGEMIIADSNPHEFSTGSTAITSSEGKSLFDGTRKMSFLTSTIGVGPISYTTLIGHRFPIKKGYVGIIHVRHEQHDSNQTPSDPPLLLEVDVPWHM